MQSYDDQPRSVSIGAGRELQRANSHTGPDAMGPPQQGHGSHLKQKSTSALPRPSQDQIAAAVASVTHSVCLAQAQLLWTDQIWNPNYFASTGQIPMAICWCQAICPVDHFRFCYLRFFIGKYFSNYARQSE